jgi:hypothetical protein
MKRVQQAAYPAAVAAPTTFELRSACRLLRISVRPDRDRVEMATELQMRREMQRRARVLDGLDDVAPLLERIGDATTVLLAKRRTARTSSTGCAPRSASG